MIVALVALFVSLGGTATATGLLITGRDVQDGSLTGRDVKNNALKGADVLESSLGRVPTAGEAQNALNAQKLDGLDSGAFSRRLWAVVDQTGALIRGSGATSAARLGTGIYQVSFSRDVAGCGWLATTTTFDGSIESFFAVTTAVPGSNKRNVVTVGTHAALDEYEDHAFHLAVFC